MIEWYRECIYLLFFFWFLWMVDWLATVKQLTQLVRHFVCDGKQGVEIWVCLPLSLCCRVVRCVEPTVNTVYIYKRSIVFFALFTLPDSIVTLNTSFQETLSSFKYIQWTQPPSSVHSTEGDIICEPPYWAWLSSWGRSLVLTHCLKTPGDTAASIPHLGTAPPPGLHISLWYWI